MEEIFFSGTPLLESVGENEPHVVELRETIQKAINQALLPLKAYARKYEEFLDLNNLDANQYVR